MIKITSEDVQVLKKWFHEYVQNFNQGDDLFTENVLLKKEHTRRVCNEILAIGNSLELTAHELNLAEITALFHDIGRFEQYIRYRTFVDGKSVNHAGLGVTILKDTRVLSLFDESTQTLIYRIISLHNLASLPENETDTCLFYARLLRDADKLDIWRVVTRYYQQTTGQRNEAIELDLPDTPGFSDKVYQDLMKGQIINIRDVRNLNDFKLLQVGWIFDINFEAAFQAVRSRHYLEMIQEVLPDNEKMRKLFDFIQSYLSNTHRTLGKK